MTNVSRPIHLQLQRPAAAAMVSSSSGTSPFGESDAGSGAGGAANQLAGAQHAPAQPAPRSTPIRPNALINFNCIAKTPTIPNSLASPMQVVSRSAGECFPAAGFASCHHTKALSPSGLNDSLPSQILPHLFVGNQEQTNRETVNKLNIKYILSLGLLPMVVANTSTTSVTTLSPASPCAATKRAAGGAPAAKPKSGHHNHHHHHQPQNLMPTRNSSRDFKIRIRSNTPTTPTTPGSAASHLLAGAAAPPAGTPPAPAESGKCLSPTAALGPANPAPAAATRPRDENKGIKQVRSVYCKCINVVDNSDQLLGKFFDEACAFIEEARRKKCNILIHCLAGISRSPTIAIAYLMRARSMHWKDAYDLVKQCRPQIDPNLNFMGQLRIYNRSLKDERSACKRTADGVGDSPMAETPCRNKAAGQQGAGAGSLAGHEASAAPQEREPAR